LSNQHHQTSDCICVVVRMLRARVDSKLQIKRPMVCFAAAKSGINKPGGRNS